MSSFNNNELSPKEKVDLFSRFYVLAHGGLSIMAVFQHGLPNNSGYGDFSDIANKMNEGTHPISVFEMTGLFSQFDLAAMRSAYDSGNLDLTLKDLANYYATVVGLDL